MTLEQHTPGQGVMVGAVGGPPPTMASAPSSTPSTASTPSPGPSAPPPPSVIPLTVVMPMPDTVDGASSAPRTSYELDSRDDIPPPKADFSAPPPYEEVTKLPTYEEVQREKTLQGEVPWPNVSVPRPPPQQPLTFLIDAESGPAEGDSALLGTDFMFFTAFVVAFVFNWVGFLLLMCFCHTIAARYGALSGFGLSLAKWTLIVKHTKVLESRENNWLWWLIMTFGLLICIRAIIQYLNIKRGWRMLSGTAQERLMFFY